jgi:hypothetical protein
MSAGGGVRGYRAALLKQWVLFITSGGTAAIATLLTNSLGIPIPPWVHAAVFVGVGLVVSSFRAWDEESRKRASEDQEHAKELAQLKTELAIARARPEPQLHLWFDQSDPMCTSVLGGDEIFRVQVFNQGTLRADEAHVVLVEMDPPVDAKLLRRRFRVMGSEIETFPVSPIQDRPAVYVDILMQRPHASYGYNQVLVMKGATWLAPLPRPLRLTLQLESSVKAQPLDITFTLDENRRLKVSHCEHRGQQGFLDSPP